MARKIKITIATSSNSCSLQDYDDVSEVINNRIDGGMGEYHWQVVEGTDLTKVATKVAFVHNSGAKFGEVKIADIESVTINGVAATITNLSLVRDAVAPYFFSFGGGGFQFYKEVNFTNSQLLNELDWGLGATPLVVLPAIADSYYSSMLFCHELTYATAAFATASQAGFYSHVAGSGSSALLVSLPTSALNFAANRVVANIQPQMGSTNVMPVYGVNEQIIYKLANSLNQTTGGGSVKIKVWYNVQKFG
jgi:hypothetical protein